MKDSNGSHVVSFMSRCDGLSEVKECEALAVVEAMLRVRSACLKNVKFEVDAKLVADSICMPGVDRTEFGLMVELCRSVLVQEPKYSVGFMKGQANEAAHLLARESCFHACPIVSFDMKSFLNTIVLNVCLIAGH
ncbi:hypothetical protein DITRI_Ditri16bG0052100 [Diplodiscus trichospermus]